MPEQVSVLMYGNGELLAVQPDVPGPTNGSPFAADPRPVGRADDARRLAGRVEESIDQIRRFGEMAINRLTSMPTAPDKVIVQMQVKVSGELGVMLAKSAAEANFTVTLEWGRDTKR
ncbi:CU044_2847 family protein [Actinoplanes palleronii]|uniref:Trypsin-co-occurring domain-containing protein n=1 Tax=Actinoplanes palleronii TaxID=113570 RepID=A0ABQ4BH20_9ACTN|nr:CU044_2847 family protein [Actinoplanes palleronii]GIE69580.1 hypothetical protein Apa02nite_056880 [Actinoplanes palleronii]